MSTGSHFSSLQQPYLTTRYNPSSFTLYCSSSTGYVEIYNNLFNNVTLNIDISILHHVIFYHTAVFKQQPILGTVSRYSFQPPGRTYQLFILYKGSSSSISSKKHTKPLFLLNTNRLSVVSQTWQPLTTTNCIVF